MQFSLRTLLYVTTFTATAFAFWPDPNRGPEAAYYLFVSLTTLLACSLLLTDAARSVAMNRERGIEKRGLNREKMALALAMCGMTPFVALWMFGLAEPHESSGRLMNRIVRGLGYLAVGSYFPATFVSSYLSTLTKTPDPFYGQSLFEGRADGGEGCFAGR